MRFRRRREHWQPQPQPPGVPGVAFGWSTTYVEPGLEPPSGWPSARQPGARVRFVPNESLLGGPLSARLGELVQEMIDEGADLGVSVETDTSDRTHPGEQRGGASPVEGIDLLIYGAASGAAGAYLAR
jgi:hypothetical protein